MPRIALAIVVNDHAELLLIKKRIPAKLNGTATLVWSYPGGKIEAGEPGYITAMRETLEETGLRIFVTPDSKLGERMHPQSADVHIEYWAGAIADQVKVIDYEDPEIEKVEWVTINKLDDYLKLDIYEGVRAYLAEHLM